MKANPQAVNRRAIGLWRELTLARLREFYREPEAVFWVYGFPILMVVGLGIAFRNQPVEQITVDVVSRSAGRGDRQRLSRPARASSSPHWSPSDEARVRLAHRHDGAGGRASSDSETPSLRVSRSIPRGRESVLARKRRRRRLAARRRPQGRGRGEGRSSSTSRAGGTSTFWCPACWA